MELRKQIVINTTGNIIYLAALWSLTVVVTWTIGYEGTGILMIAMAVGNVIAMVQMYGVRNYQSSDVAFRYSSRDYLRSRIVTITIGFLGGFAICFLLGYTWETISVVMAFILLKSSEAFSDVLFGNDQRAGYLEYAGYSMASRGIIVFLLFSAGAIVLKSLFLAMIISALGGVVLSFSVDVPLHNKTMKKIQPARDRGVFGIIKECFPLFIMTIIPAVIAAVPRIVLGRCQGTVILGLYGNVSTPALLLTTIVPTILTALLPSYGEAVRDNNRYGIYCLLNKSIAIVLLLTCVCALGILLVGKTVLATVYTDEIIPYVGYLYYLLIAMMLYTITMCNNAVFIAYRNNWEMTIIAGITLMICATISLPLVMSYGIMGAILSLGIPYAIEVLLQIIWIHKRLLREEAKE